jgi:hypothetical protein
MRELVVKSGRVVDFQRIVKVMRMARDDEAT